MARTVSLRFENIDAAADGEDCSVVSVECTRASVPHILAWYGGHHAGDDYIVAMDGERVEIDQNGEIVPVTIDA